MYYKRRLWLTPRYSNIWRFRYPRICRATLNLFMLFFLSPALLVGPVSDLNNKKSTDTLLCTIIEILDRNLILKKYFDMIGRIRTLHLPVFYFLMETILTRQLEISASNISINIERVQTNYQIGDKRTNLPPPSFPPISEEVPVVPKWAASVIQSCASSASSRLMATWSSYSADTSFQRAHCSLSSM